jgi:HK97 gp10 family phage protein
MAKKTIPLSQISNQFADIVGGMIDSYVKELETNLEPIIEEVAKDFAKDLAEGTPVSNTDGGKYGHLKDNIKVSRIRKDRQTVGFRVHFGNKGWLSTLREYGWTTVNGRLVSPKPFIRPIFDQNKERYSKKIRDSIDRQVGGKGV